MRKLKLTLSNGYLSALSGSFRQFIYVWIKFCKNILYNLWFLSLYFQYLIMKLQLKNYLRMYRVRRLIPSQNQCGGLRRVRV